MKTISQPAESWDRGFKLHVLLRRPRVLFSLVAETIRLCQRAPGLRRAGFPGALKRLWRIGTLSVTELDFFSAAHAELAPSARFVEYCTQVVEIMSLNLWMPVRRASEAEHRDFLADPAAYTDRQPTVEKIFRVEFAGVENDRAAAHDGRPVMLIAWHGGAQTHNFLRDLREQFPRLEVFSAYREVFPPCATGQGLFFTTPLLENPKLGMLRMAKALEEGRPTLLHFDGIAGKRDAACRLFGLPLYLGRGFIHVARQCHAAVLPVTACFLRDQAIRVRIGRPLFSEEELQAMTDEQLLNRTMSYFVDDTREHNPAGILFGRLLEMVAEPSQPG